MLGIEEVVTAARSPWQNPYAERLIGSLLGSAWTTSSCWTKSTSSESWRSTQVLQRDPMPPVPGRRCPGAPGRAGAGVRRGVRARGGGWTPPSIPAGCGMTAGSGSRDGPIGPAVRADGVFGNDRDAASASHQLLPMAVIPSWSASLSIFSSGKHRKSSMRRLSVRSVFLNS